MALITPTSLEPAWESALRRALGRSVDDRALAVMVERLSRKYNGELGVSLAHGDELAARSLFFFARDVHKIALPLLELAFTGALPSRPLRVLDLGAGTGATTLGLLRAATHPAARGFTVESITAVDSDPQALALLKRVFTEVHAAGLLPGPAPALETRTIDLAGENTAPAWEHGFDLVLAGSVLVELTRGAGDPEARGRRVAELAEHWITSSALAPDGALVIVEPATREETRALHFARKFLLERGLGIFAPCTHERDCPMLERDRDWCHEDLSVDLPDWLVPVARAAGLRWQGLTFSYLVVRRDHTRSVREVLDEEGRAAGFVPARLVSAPRPSKGKTEVFASGDFPGPTRGPRLIQLDREVKRHGESQGKRGVVLEDCARGDVVALSPEAAARAIEGKPVRVAPGEIERAKIP